jgi:phosphoribosyl-ATP pyrophosphohydrolase/phosphoribosyl-AMP cyclohydrolase
VTPVQHLAGLGCFRVPTVAAHGIFVDEADRQLLREGRVDSYVATLFASGTRRIAQKVGEEAVEFSLAAAAGNRTEQIEEAADLLFHIQVLLASLDISLTEVDDCLRARHGQRSAGPVK